MLTCPKERVENRSYQSHYLKNVEKEKERVLQLQVEIKQLTRSFFVGVGDRLKEIISQKLYKSLGYNTAAVYCPQELGITDRQARYLMAAAEVYHNERKSEHDFRFSHAHLVRSVQSVG